MKKAMFGIVVFLVAFAVPVAVYSLIDSRGDFDTREEASTGENDVNTGKPSIVSVPLTEISVGDSYSYRVRATDDQGDELDYRVSAMPSWTEWDSGTTTISGVPAEDDIGTHRFEVIVSDGVWVDTQTFEVDVLGDVNPEGTGTQMDIVDEEINSPDEEESRTGLQDAALSGDDLERYGLTAQSSEESEAENTQSEVLGTSVLPQTSVFKGVLGLSIGSGIIALAAFLLADAKTGLFQKTVMWFDYQRGKQVRMDVGEGVKVKKRKIRI